MDADEIIVHREQRDRIFVIFDFLGECIGEPMPGGRPRGQREAALCLNQSSPLPWPVSWWAGIDCRSGRIRFEACAKFR
jgi:hypothetical protein